MLYPSMPSFAFMAWCSLFLSCSTFAIKCSWQIVYMLINFAWLLVVIHVPYDYAIVMHSFIFMRSYCWLHFHAMYCSVVSGSSSPTCLLIIISAMLCFSSKSESGYETCYVYIGGIISFVPFWIVISNGILFYAISRFMPYLCLLWSVPVACWFRALNIATWCCFLPCPVFHRVCDPVIFCTFAMLVWAWYVVN